MRTESDGFVTVDPSDPVNCEICGWKGTAAECGRQHCSSLECDFDWAVCANPDCKHNLGIAHAQGTVDPALKRVDVADSQSRTTRGEPWNPKIVDLDWGG